MAHLLRALPDAAWKRGYVTVGNDLKAIDQNTFLAINGDEGGSWSPAAPIVIAGAGVVVAGPWTMSGAGVSVTTGVTAPITFGKNDASDFFGFDPGHSAATPSVFCDFGMADSALASQAIGGEGVVAAVPGARFHMPLSVYSGAPFIGVVGLVFHVTQNHANVPQVLPRMRVIAVASDGTVTPLRAPDATTDADGFQFFPTPVSGAAWRAGGAAQTWTYTCNVVLPIASDTYLYYVEIIEESGTGAWTATGTWFINCTAAYGLTAIFDARN